MSKASDGGVRRSGREKRARLSYSPPPGDHPTSSGASHRKKTKNLKTSAPNKSETGFYDLTPDGNPFCCEMCGTHHVINPYKKKLTGIRKPVLPRQRFDPISGQYLMLCNACCVAKMRQSKKTTCKPVNKLSYLDEKEQYLQEAKSFADSLVTSMGDNYAEKLYCPRFTSKPCRCIQTYLVGADKDDDYKGRAFHLIKLIHTALKYSSLKSYDLKDVIGPNGKKKGKVGLGEGHKKSKTYEDFVMTHRKQLKEECNLCEIAIKKILCYSNNFLFKKLKSKESQCRIKKIKGKGRQQGGLKSIAALGKEKCCHGSCTVMALSHHKLLEEWRERAAQGQLEARRVVAEMLTPSGLHTNCYAFIKCVTGVTASVISAVSNYMRETGGCRDPPPHGLKAFWENHPKRNKPVSRSQSFADSDQNEVEIEVISVNSPSHTNPCDSMEQVHHLGSHRVLVENLPLSTRQLLESVHGAAGSAGQLEESESSGACSEEHMEYITVCNPDGSTQVVKVPVVAYSSPESDTLLHDLQMPNTVMLETGQAVLQPADIILDHPLAQTGSIGQSSSGQNSCDVIVYHNSRIGSDSSVTMVTEPCMSLTGGSRSELLQNSVTRAFDGNFTENNTKEKYDTSVLEYRVRDESLINTNKQITKPPSTSHVCRNLSDVHGKHSGGDTQQHRTESKITNFVSNLAHTNDQKTTDFTDVRIKNIANRDIQTDNFVSNISNDTGDGEYLVSDIQIVPSVDQVGNNSNVSFTLHEYPANSNSVEVVQPEQALHLANSVPYPPNAQVIAIKSNFVDSAGLSRDQLPYTITSQHASYINVPSSGEQTKICTTLENIPTRSVSVISQLNRSASTNTQISSVQTPKTISQHLSVVNNNQASSNFDVKLLKNSRHDLVPRTLSDHGVKSRLDTLISQVMSDTSSEQSSSIGRSHASVIQSKTINSAVMDNNVMRRKYHNSNIIRHGLVRNDNVVLSSSYPQLNVVSKVSSKSVVNRKLAPKSVSLQSVHHTPKPPLSAVSVLNFVPNSMNQAPVFARVVMTTNSQAQPITPSVVTSQVSILPRPIASSVKNLPNVPQNMQISGKVSLSGTTQSSINAMFNSGIISSVLPASVLSTMVNPGLSPMIIPGVPLTPVNKLPKNPIGIGNVANLQMGHFAPTSVSRDVIILHNTAANQPGGSGSFSLQHLTNQRAGSIAIEHGGQGGMFVTHNPKSTMQPVLSNFVKQVPPVTQNHQNTIMVPAAGNLLPLRPQISDKLLQLPINRLSQTTSAKHHLKELLPTLPTVSSPGQ